MKVQSLFPSFCLAGQVLGLGVPALKPYTDQEIAETLINSPHLFPFDSYKIIHAKLKGLAKREPQTSIFDPKSIATFGGVATAWLKSLFPDKNAPKSKVSDMQEEKPEGWNWPSVKRMKVRYGPYRVAPTSEKNWDSELLNIQGMSHTIDIGIKKPHSKNHKILSMVGTLEYADGSVAEADSGLRFHHLVLFNTGKDVRPPLCRNETTEILYMQGGEKAMGYYALGNSTIKSGYPVTEIDRFVLNTQLMNTQDKEKYVWVVLTYDYIPDGQDVRPARLSWMSMGDLVPQYCAGLTNNPWGTRNVTYDLIPKSDKFMENSIPMPYPSDGLFYGASAHVHNGGTSVEIYQNSKMVCDSLPIYGKGGPAHSHGGTENASDEQIMEQTRCQYPDPLPVKAGDKFWMRVRYDFNQHPGEKNTKGEYTSIMGIVGMLISE